MNATKTKPKHKPGPRRHRVNADASHPAIPADTHPPEPQPDAPPLGVKIDAEAGTLKLTFTSVPDDRRADVAARVGELKAKFLCKLKSLHETPEGVALAKTREQRACAEEKLRDLEAVAASLREDLGSGRDDATVEALGKRLAEVGNEIRARECTLRAIQGRFDKARIDLRDVAYAAMPIFVRAERDETGAACRAATAKLWNSIADHLVNVWALMEYHWQIPSGERLPDDVLLW